MAFALHTMEPVAEGIRRIAHEQLAEATGALSAGGDADIAIHTARKAMKRLRAVIRLVGGILDADTYRVENRTFRDAGRQLAPLRDASVLLATLDQLAGRVGGENQPVVARAREVLESRRQAVWHGSPTTPGAEEVVEAVTATLLAADVRVDCWPLHKCRWKTVAAGLVDGYRRGQAEHDACSWQPATESMHRWRKRVKYLAHQTQIVEPVWPVLMRAWQSELDRLAGMLGEDHDLAVLASVLQTHVEGVDALIATIGTQRYHLQADARVLGMRLYAERSRDLRRRLRAGRRAWREELLKDSMQVGAAPAFEPALKSGYEPVRVADTRCRTGDGPLWHAAEGRIYWVDIPAGRLYRYDPATSRHEMVFEAAGAIGGFTIQADGALLLFLAGGAVAIWRQGEALQTVVEGIDVERASRFNDVIADPVGRVYCGTVAQGEDGGRLYRLDTDGSLTELLDGLGCSNGMGFSPDQRFLYHIDSPTRQISRFAWDERSGALRDRQVHVDTQHDARGPADMPCGITVDADGYLWSARWGAGCLVRYDPEGHEDRRVSLAARNVSSATFGGADLDELYVTTAGGHDRSTEGAGAGALFRLRPGVRGRAEFVSRVCL